MGITESNRNRLKRIDWIMTRLRVAKEKKRDVDKQKLIAVCALDTNCAERTARETLQTLERAGKIEMRKGSVWI